MALKITLNFVKLVSECPSSSAPIVPKYSAAVGFCSLKGSFCDFS